MSIIVDDKNLLVSNLKGLLQEKLWLLEERLKQKRLSSPYQMLTDAEARILATLRGETLTIAEVARKLNVSRQAVHKIVSSLVHARLLKLEPIANNARDKRILFTKEGERMKEIAAKALQELEKEVAMAIGKKNVTLLKLLLAKKW